MNPSLTPCVPDRARCLELRLEDRGFDTQLTVRIVQLGGRLGAQCGCSEQTELGGALI